jgi:hypothetical protein
VTGSAVGGNPHSVFHGWKERKKGDVVRREYNVQSITIRTTEKIQNSSKTHHGLFLFLGSIKGSLALFVAY